MSVKPGKITLHRETVRSAAQAMARDELEHEETLRKIIACKTLDEVDAAIGNTSWTYIKCDVCDRAMRGVLRIERHYTEDGALDLCGRCFRRLVKVAERAGLLLK